jgi:hypothetical protein
MLPSFHWDLLEATARQEFNAINATWSASLLLPSVSRHRFFRHRGPGIHHLVGGCATPLKKYEFVEWDSSDDDYSQLNGTKNVPNHQLAILPYFYGLT